MPDAGALVLAQSDSGGERGREEIARIAEILETSGAIETAIADDPVEGELDLKFVAARLDAGDTFVYVHDKRADEAGHTKDPREKQRAIEQLDAELAPALRLAERAVVCITGDHATPASPEVIHSGDPVPLLVAGPAIRADAATSFGELPCAAGILGRLRGSDLMPVLLNAA